MPQASSTAAAGRRAPGVIAASIGFALAVALATTPADAQPKWADPAKSIRVMFPVAETGFDPQATSD
ncbi:MAG: hypothetical protein ABI724_11165, partial [Betaproteobacteria bacterium]